MPRKLSEIKSPHYLHGGYKPRKSKHGLVLRGKCVCGVSIEVPASDRDDLDLYWKFVDHCHEKGHLLPWERWPEVAV